MTRGGRSLVRKRFTLGGPARCGEDLQMIRDMLGPTHLVMKMKFPGLSHELVMGSIRRFGERVMPHAGH
jgi:hypothetical protein